MDTLLDTLGLSEEDLTEPDLTDLVPGLRDTNRYVELDTIRLRERIQINSDPAGTEYYGFSQYYLLYYPEKEGKTLLPPPGPCMIRCWKLMARRKAASRITWSL